MFIKICVDETQVCYCLNSIVLILMGRLMSALFALREIINP